MVPNPTLITFIYSLSIFKTSPREIEDIPLNPNTVEDAPTWPPLLTEYVNKENAIGDWTILLIEMMLLLLFWDISNVWVVPIPTDVKVTAIAGSAIANSFLVAILNESLLILIA